jgi:hypothetical protein
MAVAALALFGCVGGGDDFTITGRVAPGAVARTVALAAPDRTITHVMAVDPETASPHSTLAAVGADGSFELTVRPGTPYVLVFVDDTAVGADMAVGIFRAGTLHSIAPQLAGHIELGDVSIDPTTQTATSGLGYDELLTSLGLSAAGAEYLGAIDDLSLRYANPDIDGNGVIDLVENRSFALTFVVGSTLHSGSSTGRILTIDDITDKFLPDSGPDVATPVFDQTFVYAEYPAVFDSTVYVVAGGPATSLLNGGQYTVTEAAVAAMPSGYSSTIAGTGTVGWGAIYNFDQDPGLELPGSSGSPATLAFTLGGIGTSLTFTNVVTPTQESFAASGTLAVFLRLDTTAGVYTSIDYRWMKRASATSWVPATAEEIALTISSDGAYVGFQHVGTTNGPGFAIPASASGTIVWDQRATRPDDICAMAVSYDDRLGLQHFIGAVLPNPGISCP